MITNFTILLLTVKQVLLVSSSRMYREQQGGDARVGITTVQSVYLHAPVLFTHLFSAYISTCLDGMGPVQY